MTKTNRLQIMRACNIAWEKGTRFCHVEVPSLALRASVGEQNRVRRAAVLLGLCFTMLAGLLAFDSTLHGEEPKGDDAYYHSYWLDVRPFSIIPGQELATYRSYSSGGTSPAGTLTVGAGDKDRQFSVSVQGKLKENRYLTTVTVIPEKEGSQVKAQEIEYDFSDLVPRTLEIARDEEGRVYQVHLLPKIILSPKPKPFNVSELRLESWHFQGSPVVVNDQDYMGEMNMAGGPFAYCDIPGLAKIEFSLLPLKNGTPIGTLSDGVLRITHECGTTLKISNVMNGRGVLDGGPYQVWVRWKKPTQSMEEFQESIKQRIETIKERIKNGDDSLQPGSLERLEKMLASGRAVQSMSAGIGGFGPDDREKE